MPYRSYVELAALPHVAVGALAVVEDQVYDLDGESLGRLVLKQGSNSIQFIWVKSKQFILSQSPI